MTEATRVSGAGSAGLRWGLALAAWEIGLAAPARLGGLEGLHHQALLFLAPLAGYAVLGWIAGSLAGVVARAAPERGRTPLREVILGAAAVAVGVADVQLSPASLRGGGILAWSGLPVALACASLPLWMGARARPLVRRVGAAVVLAGGALHAAWFGFGRDAARLPLPDRRPPEDAPSVVMVTWDTVRADVLPPYGGTGLQTPELDRLAEEGLVFEDMVAVAPITGPSHATLLTGRVPPSHGLRSMGTTAIGAEVPSLAHAFRQAGYDTGAFVSAMPLRRGFGFERGFRVYDDRLRLDRLSRLVKIGPKEMALGRWLRRFTKHHSHTQLPGETVVERAATFLAEADRPVFLWAHFFDAHGPHDPAAGLLAAVEDDAAAAVPRAADPAACAESLTLYRAEIMELDAHLGALRGALESVDPGLARTAVLLVADHGQCFGEAGLRNTHTPSIHEATQHVPAILRMPGAERAGERVAWSASQIDVAATLTALAGVPSVPDHQGVDLIAALDRGGPPPRGLFDAGFYVEAWQKRLARSPTEDGVADLRKVGLRTKEWKLWYHAGVPEERHLHRILPDGSEEPADDPVVHARMSAALSALESALPRVEGAEFQMSRDDREDLAALGYVDVDDEP